MKFITIRGKRYIARRWEKRHRCAKCAFLGNNCLDITCMSPKNPRAFYDEYTREYLFGVPFEVRHYYYVKDTFINRLKTLLGL